MKLSLFQVGFAFILQGTQIFLGDNCVPATGKVIVGPIENIPAVGRDRHESVEDLCSFGAVHGAIVATITIEAITNCLNLRNGFGPISTNRAHKSGNRSKVGRVSATAPPSTPAATLAFAPCLSDKLNNHKAAVNRNKESGSDAARPAENMSDGHRAKIKSAIHCARLPPSAFAADASNSAEPMNNRMLVAAGIQVLSPRSRMAAARNAGYPGARNASNRCPVSRSTYAARIQKPVGKGQIVLGVRKLHWSHDHHPPQSQGDAKTYQYRREVRLRQARDLQIDPASCQQIADQAGRQQDAALDPQGSRTNFAGVAQRSEQ